MSDLDYLHGLVATDGSLKPTGSPARRRYQTTIQTRDRVVYEDLASRGFEIKTYDNSNGNVCVSMYGLRLDLKTSIPDIEDPRDYARGLIDGDGCMIIRSPRHNTPRRKLEGIGYYHPPHEQFLGDWYKGFLTAHDIE